MLFLLDSHGRRDLKNPNCCLHIAIIFAWNILTCPNYSIPRYISEVLTSHDFKWASLFQITDGCRHLALQVRFLSEILIPSYFQLLEEVKFQVGGEFGGFGENNSAHIQKIQQGKRAGRTSERFKHWHVASERVL